MTDRDEMREKVARALRQRGHNVIPEDVDAVLAVLPQYEQVGWWNRARGVHPLQSSAKSPTHEYECYVTDVPVYIVREDTDAA